MLVSVVNRCTSISDEELLRAVRAVNRQLREDFEPYWALTAQLRVEGAFGQIGTGKTHRLADMRGDAVLYLMEDTDVEEALGYHDKNARGIPFGFVFMKLARDLGENWTVTLSHEALELVADTQTNLLVRGPHPLDANKIVFHYYEMCDAVQDETYQIDGVEVSNFVLPAYFTPGDEKGSRNDFLHRLDSKGHALKSFGVKPGGYIGFFDPATGLDDTYSLPRDEVSAKRQAVKSTVAAGRSHTRKKRASSGTL